MMITLEIVYNLPDKIIQIDWSSEIYLEPRPKKFVYYTELPNNGGWYKLVITHVPQVLSLQQLVKGGMDPKMAFEIIAL